MIGKNCPCTVDEGSIFIFLSFPVRLWHLLHRRHLRVLRLLLRSQRCRRRSCSSGQAPAARVADPPLLHGRDLPPGRQPPRVAVPSSTGASGPAGLLLLRGVPPGAEGLGDREHGHPVAHLTAAAAAAAARGRVSEEGPRTEEEGEAVITKT